ncbi:carboxy-S-adenosyl-L-methionine synthase CmoA [Pseudobacteriovorax antillogorgiicola]|uniref:Carboxy-S-adenosyl-L-methionine synthase n=1 Tax=Pseudobacteriovorax antillogorgiicola TaxID=1513793 RepID=A0A1Y6CM84_9BACT|nr:carboxy-S-adenosyl-L-methionine synthase CmoA [Pseudobacteriovorax antillogorgiicola]TCS45019.1 tRNA (cmo5U34)-methyltransferase [Pseudobacteriovorax antillogorgiicola]SMF76335.1 tRNA (cmo5U34)-methyltransferase [Pseudobacteriovorax antillogorgiicola]
MQEIPRLVLNSKKDELFASKQYPKPFAFNAEVAGVFDDMVKRSIPLYCDVTTYLGDWALDYYKAGSHIYDIGCSTGTTMIHLAQRLEKPVTFFGVDNSSAMIAKAEEKLDHAPEQHRYQLICDDVMNVAISNASVVIINYTLQFLPITQRLALLQKIYDGLCPGGILFVSEKVRFDNPQFQETSTKIYEEFKERQGYSRTEIEKKKEALDNVLIPFTEQEHKDFLGQAGFSHCDSVMKWNNFMSLVAFKGYS